MKEIFAYIGIFFFIVAIMTSCLSMSSPGEKKTRNGLEYTISLTAKDMFCLSGLFSSQTDLITQAYVTEAGEVIVFDE